MSGNFGGGVPSRSTAVDMPRDQAAILVGLGQCSNELSMLHDALTRLESRLGMVMRPVNTKPEAVADGNRPVACQSEMAGQLGGIVNGIDGATRRLRELEERLEL